MKSKKYDFRVLDAKIITVSKRAFAPIARFSLFLIFFWFGIIKLLGLSPASPMAEALTSSTVGMQYFEPLFYTLAVIECVIGVMFLIPRLTRIVIPLLLFHMVIVCSPLVLTPHYTWQSLLVPNLEGQYIIKNAIVVALAIGLVAFASPPKVRRTE